MIPTLTLSISGSRDGSRRPAIDANLRSAEVVYIIANDWRVRERFRNDLTLRGIRVETFDCADEFLEYPRGDSTACVVAELQRGDLARLQRHLKEGGGPPIIFTGTQADTPSGIRAIKAGAVDFLIYPVKSEELCCSVREALRRHRVLRQRDTEIAALKVCYLSLTRREREVLQLLVRGFLNKHVAKMLAISLVTVQAHRSNTMRKMGARSFASLVWMAIKLRILERDSQDEFEQAEIVG